MNHNLKTSIKLFAAAMAVALPLVALTGGATAGEPQSHVIGTSVSVDQLRADFTRRGYELEPAIAWAWLSPSVTTFQVHDARGDRVLLVQVFDDASRAEAAPMPCYGASALVGNVAIFESMADDLRACLAAGVRTGMEDERDVPEARARPSGVEAEFIGLVSRVSAGR